MSEKEVEDECASEQARCANGEQGRAEAEKDGEEEADQEDSEDEEEEEEHREARKIVADMHAKMRAGENNLAATLIDDLMKLQHRLEQVMDSDGYGMQLPDKIDSSKELDSFMDSDMSKHIVEYYLFDLLEEFHGDEGEAFRKELFDYCKDKDKDMGFALFAFSRSKMGNKRAQRLCNANMQAIRDAGKPRAEIEDRALVKRMVKMLKPPCPQGSSKLARFIPDFDSEEASSIASDPLGLAIYTAALRSCEYQEDSPIESPCDWLIDNLDLEGDLLAMTCDCDPNSVKPIGHSLAVAHLSAARGVCEGDLYPRSLSKIWGLDVLADADHGLVWVASNDYTSKPWCRGPMVLAYSTGSPCPRPVATPAKKVKKGEPSHILKGDSGPLAVLSDRLVVGDQIWNIPQLCSLTGNAVTSSALKPVGKLRLVKGDQASSLQRVGTDRLLVGLHAEEEGNKPFFHIYDVVRESMIGMLTGHVDDPNCLGRQLLFQRDQYFVTCDSRCAKLWDVRSFNPVMTLPGIGMRTAMGMPTSSAVFVATGGEDEAITIWDVRGGRKAPATAAPPGVLYKFSTGNQRIRHLVFHEGTQSLVASVINDHATSYGMCGSYRYGEALGFGDGSDSEGESVSSSESDHSASGGGGDFIEKLLRRRRFSMHGKWPKRAFHPKGYFESKYNRGHNGQPSLLRYVFQGGLCAMENEFGKAT